MSASQQKQIYDIICDTIKINGDTYINKLFSNESTLTVINVDINTYPIGLPGSLAYDPTFNTLYISDGVSWVVVGNAVIPAPLLSIADLTTVANETLYTTAPDTYAVTALTPFARTNLLTANNASDIRTAIGAVSGPVSIVNRLPKVSGVNTITESGISVDNSNNVSGANSFVVTKNGNNVSVTADSSLSASYTYRYPAAGPTGNAQVVTTSGATNVFYDLHAQQTVTVRKNPGPNEFSSVAAAAASILDSTSFKRYIIFINSGDYTEGAFAVPDYTTLVGSSTDAVRLTQSGSGSFITLGAEGGIAFLTVYSSAAATPAVTASAVNTRIASMVFNGCQQGVSAVGSGTSNLDTVTFINSTQFAIRATNGSTVYVSTLSTSGSSANAIIVDNSDISITNGTLQGDGTGNAISILNGGTVNSTGVYIDSWTNGVYVPSDANTPTALLSGTLYNNCTTNINVLNVNCVGLNDSYTAYSKSVYPKSAPFFVATQNQNVITVAPKGANFTSVGAALTAITDNSVTQRYTIIIAPGIYVEHQLQMKSYVTVQGFFQTQTVLAAHPDCVGIPFIIGIENAAIDKLTLTVANGSFAPNYLVEFNGSAAGIHFRVDNTIFDSTASYIHVNSTVGDTIFLLMNPLFNMSAQFQRGIVVEDAPSGTNSIQMIIDNLIWKADSAGIVNFTELINVKSYKNPGTTPPNVLFVLTNSSLSSYGNTGTAVVIEGNVTATLETCIFAGFNTAVSVAPSAVASQVIISSSTFQQNTIDFTDPNSDTIGSISANADKSKVSIASDSIGVVINDTAGGIVLSGPIYQGQNWSVVTDVSTQIQHAAATGMVSPQVDSDITDAGGLTVSVAAGSGYIFNGSDLKKISWNSTNVILPDNALSWLYVNSSGTVGFSGSETDPIQTVLLGAVKTTAGAVEYIQRFDISIDNLASNITKIMRLIGPQVISGCLAAPGSNATFRSVQVISGSYVLGSNNYTPGSNDNVTMITYFNGVSSGSTVTNVPLNYDNSGVLTAIPSGKWAKHSLYLLSSLSGVTQYFLVYSQAIFNSQILANSGALPNTPTTFVENMIPISAIVVSGDDTFPLSSDRFIDIRPLPILRSSTSSSANDHNTLLNLTVGDAHPQYFRTDGTRVMGGDINLGSNNISGSGGNTFNSVDPTAHGSRHNPGGADALAVAAPVDVGNANATGVAGSYSLSDHIHAHGIHTNPSDHAIATSIAAGFMSASDKFFLDAATPSDTVLTLVKRGPAGEIYVSTIYTSDLVTDTISGAITFNSDVTINGVLNATRGVFSSDLTSGNLYANRGTFSSDVTSNTILFGTSAGFTSDLTCGIFNGAKGTFSSDLTAVNTTVQGTLTVTGVTTLNSDLTVNGVLSSRSGIFASDLTSGVFTATKGTFTSDLTCGIFNATKGIFSGDLTCGILTGNSASFTNITVFNVSVQAALILTGYATFNSDVTVSGILSGNRGTFSSNLTSGVFSATSGTFSSDLTANQLTVSGVATLNSDLTLLGLLSGKKATFTSDLTAVNTTVQGTLTVTGTSTMNSDLIVNGTISGKKGTFTSDLTCDSLTVSDTLLANAITINTSTFNGLLSAKQANFTSSTTVSGLFSATNGSALSGNTVLNGKLFGTNAIFSSDVTFNGNAIFPTTSDVLIFGTTNSITVAAVTPSGSRTYTIPDVGANGTFALATNTASSGYVLTATTTTGSGNPTWQAPTGVSTLTGTANQITASASTGAVTLSIPSTLNVNKGTFSSDLTCGIFNATKGSFSSDLNCGILNANRGNFSSDITVRVLAATLTATFSNTVSVTNGLTALGTTSTQGTLTARSATFNSDVTFNGNLTAARGTFNSDLTTQNTTVQGTFNATTGTFSSDLTVNTVGVKATSNQLTLGTTNTTTISATAPSSSRTYTLPDVGADATFALATNSATSGYVLTATASGSGNPTWQAAAGGSVVSSITGTANQITASASTGAVTLSIPATLNVNKGTFSSDLTVNTASVKATSNQLTLGTTNTTTISATAPASSVVYTIPDIGAAGTFVLTTNSATNNFGLVATSSNGTASWQAIQRTLYTQRAITSLTFHAGSDISLFQTDSPPTATGSLTIPANTVQAGTSIYFDLTGVANIPAQQPVMTLYLGTTAIASTVLTSNLTALSAASIHCYGKLTFYTVGSSGTCWGQAVMVTASKGTAAGSTMNYLMTGIAIGSIAAITIDTTASQTLDLKTNWSTLGTLAMKFGTATVWMQL